MLCDDCKKADATIHYTEIVDDKIIKINLCKKCAGEKGLEVDESFSVGNLLSGLVFEKTVSEKTVRKTCPRCRLTLSGFKKTGRLGCPECYKTFRDFLTMLLGSIHKKTVHTGKKSIHVKNSISSDDNIAALKSKLKTAIKNEAFEEAARLRDEIKKIKGK